jgi:integrase
MALTESLVKSLVSQGSGGKDLVHWDSQVNPGGKRPAISGFGLRISPKNYFSWLLQYQVHEQDSKTGEWRPTRKNRRMSIGSYPEMNLSQAMERCSDLKGLIRSGIDPQVRTASKHTTLQEWIHGIGRKQGYYEVKKAQGSRSFKEMHRRIELWIIPTLGHIPLKDITQDDVTGLQIEIGEDPDGKRKSGGAKVEANRVIARLSDIFTQARKKKVVGKDFVSPTADVDHYPEQSRERILTPGEAQNFMDAVVSKGDHYFEAFVWVLRLTGLRLNEARTLKWKEVDLAATQKTIVEDKIVDIPSPTVTIRRMEAKNNRTLVLPLNPEAKTVFEQIKKIAGNEYVFPRTDPRLARDARKSVAPQPFKRLWNEVRDQTETRYGETRITWHDLRRTLGTTMAVNSSISTIGKVLNQKHASATEVYVRVQQGEMRDAMNKAGQVISDLHDGISLSPVENES